MVDTTKDLMREKLADYVSTKILLGEAKLYGRPFTSNELKFTLDSMPKGKSPGKDLKSPMMFTLAYQFNVCHCHI